MPGRKGSKQMTEKHYKQMKMLLNAGLKSTQVIEFTGRSGGTVARVKAAENYADYVEIGRRYRTKSPIKQAETPQPKEDFSLVLAKLTNIENCLNTLLEVVQDKEAKANASFWRR